MKPIDIPGAIRCIENNIMVEEEIFFINIKNVGIVKFEVDYDNFEENIPTSIANINKSDAKYHCIITRPSFRGKTLRYLKCVEAAYKILFTALGCENIKRVILDAAIIIHCIYNDNKIHDLNIIAEEYLNEHFGFIARTKASVVYLVNDMINSRYENAMNLINVLYKDIKLGEVGYPQRMSLLMSYAGINTDFMFNE